MSLQQTIESDFITAYKARQEIRVAVLRMLKTALKNRQVELLRELGDADVLDVIAKQAKQRKESIEQFDAAGRKDLADRERAELEFLEAYLPRQLSDEELAAAVDAAVAEVGASGMKDMGAVMKALMAAHKGQFDGAKASAAVRSKLS
ncbi:GatB/YqeY family protein [Desulfovibrio sp. X2]|uniref:GatB/YqeY domain-containing protein n=1 Tax=Desulfovibrio sp. X2 TaxID=941449 RepID=UPI000358EACB|nr:GatB/YqeY domain-containing protein [Desulfovibrio sp. X2]EPR42239.1 GatB/YqeY family protein [Desulfovibrio sp. X2]